MAYIRLIRVFLSSPGDVTEERQIALEAIERLPNRPAFREKVAFSVVAWDKTEAGTPMRATLTPQEAINKGLPRPSECDIVMVIFSSRMGTPLTIDGQEYQSGTHWELLDALHSDLPQTVLYRCIKKKLFEVHDIEGQEQYKRVEAFFKSDLFYDPATGKLLRGVNTYETPDRFRQQFETHLEKLVVELLEQLAIEVPPQATERRPPSPENVEPLQQAAIEAPPEPRPETTPNITTIATTPWIGSPFPGLRAFTPTDAPIYFGRGQETDALVQRVAASRFVAVVGASGSGKSSLVGAGLMPRLKANAIPGSKDWVLPDWNAEVRQWVGLRFTPGEVGDNPFMALGLKLAPLTGDTPRDLAEKLTKTPDALTESCARLLKNKPEWAEVLLFIDQFEELFTLVHPQYVTPFVDLLETAIQSQQIRTVATLRADFYARCVEIPKLADILEVTTYPLAAPTPTELRDMVTRPAEQAGLEFEKGLPERILKDTGTEPGALALMAYALDELYHSGAGDRRLTNTEYEALGGVQGAIGKRAETVFLALDVEAQNALPAVFQEIVEVDERGEPTRRRAELSLVAPDAAAKHLVEALTGERARLLVQDKDVQGRPMVEVAHEALLRQWPHLRGWIEQEQDNLRLRRHIGLAAQEWAERGRNPAYRLSGGRLLDAQAWMERFPAGEVEREFILISTQLEHERKEQELELARQATENARRAEAAERDRATRYKRWAQIVGSLLLLAVIFIVAAVLVAGDASSRSTQAQHAQQTSIAREATVQLQETVAALQAGNDARWVAVFRELPGTAATLLPIEIINTATAWAVPRTAPVVEKKQDVVMVFVPAGCFVMGSAWNSDEQPVQKVCIDKPFWIDRYEVTNEQFARFNGQAGRDSGSADPNQPREMITWFEAREFCEKQRGMRLPSEAEWEYAARGSTSQQYPWGNEFVPDNAVFSRNSGFRTAEVGEGIRSDGQSWVGAYDMSGNVWEWTSTIYNPDVFPYPYNPDDGREDPVGIGRRVVRGGSYRNDSINLRAANRGWTEPENWGAPANEFGGRGFRCARSE